MAGEVTVARFVLFEQVAPGCEDLPSDLNSGADLYFFVIRAELFLTTFFEFETAIDQNPRLYPSCPFQQLHLVHFRSKSLFRVENT